MKKIQNRLLKKLKGYQKAHRARFILLKEGRLTQEEFLLYEAAVAITDWDSKHDTYGTFEATNQELAETLGWKSDTSVLRYKNSLIKKGLFIVTEDSRLRVKGFEKWQIRKLSSETEISTAEIQIDSSNLENETAKIKEERIQNNDYPLVSFKDNSSLSNYVSDEALSDEELDRIVSDIDSENSQLPTATSVNLDEEDIVSAAERVFGAKAGEIEV